MHAASVTEIECELEKFVACFKAQCGSEDWEWSMRQALHHRISSGYLENVREEKRFFIFCHFQEVTTDI